MVVRGLVRRVVRGVVRRVVRGVGSVGSPRSGGQFFQLSPFTELDQQSSSVRVFQGTLGAFISTKKSGLNFRQIPVLAN